MKTWVVYGGSYVHCSTRVTPVFSPGGALGETATCRTTKVAKGLCGIFDPDKEGSKILEPIDWTFSSGKIIELDGGFSNKPRLLKDIS